jgi:hypothetical protein
MQVQVLGGGWYQLPPELGSEKIKGKDNVQKRMQELMKQSASTVIDKIAIIGYAPSRNLVPWSDPTFSRWGLNDMYRMPDMTGAGPDGKGLGYQLWFQLHNRTEITRMRSPGHEEWLANQENVPAIVMQKHYPEFPRSVEFPIGELVSRWRDFFTNTISYMIGLALLQNTVPAPDEIREAFGIEWVRKPGGVREIHLYGIDMAAGEEFEYQRSSVEYYCGLAEAMGFKLYIPPRSDILKTPRRYGYEGAFSILDKIRQRDEEQAAEVQQVQAQLQQTRDHLMNLVGAQSERSYLRRNWTFDVAHDQEWYDPESEYQNPKQTTTAPEEG